MTEEEIMEYNYERIKKKFGYTEMAYRYTNVPQLPFHYILDMRDLLNIIEHEKEKKKELEEENKQYKLLSANIDKANKIIEENKYLHSELDKQQLTINNYAKELDQERENVICKFLSNQYIHKDRIRGLMGKVDEKYCPGCCKCGLCDALDELLEG